MSKLGHLEQKMTRSSRRNAMAATQVKEKRLQSLLDFIDTRMQDQRSKLRRQIEDTQQTAEEMEERRHRATLQVLKNYFEVTSGRLRAPSQFSQIHDERMTGVLSEPSLATVPEVDPEILAKPRSMYDRITRNLDTSRLPLIAPRNKGLIAAQQSRSMPNTLPNSTRSDESSTPRVIVTPRETSPSITPKHSGTPSDSTEDTSFDDVKMPQPFKKERSNRVGTKANTNGLTNGHVYVNESRSESPSVQPTPRRYAHRNADQEHHHHTYDQLNGHVYQKGALKPASRLNVAFEETETPTPRLGDLVASKRGLSRHSSLKRPMRSNLSSVSTMSLSELQPTRKEQAASKLKHALKAGGSFRIQR